MAEREPVLIGPVVLAELASTLRRRAPRAAIAAAIRALTCTAKLFDEAVMGKALDAYAEGSADFSDYLLAATHEAAGCTATLTFDRQALTHPQLVHPGD